MEQPSALRITYTPYIPIAIESSSSQPYTHALREPLFPRPRSHRTPATPWPTLWQCHRCGSTQVLAATRRCLGCSHLFCNARTSSSRDDWCLVDFDMGGWEAWAEWRRDVVDAYASSRASSTTVASIGVKQSCSSGSGNGGSRLCLRKQKAAPLAGRISRFGTRSEVRRRAKRREEKLRRYEEMTYDCWTDCDWPRQCHHEALDIALRRMDELDLPIEWDDDKDKDDNS